MLQAKLLQQKIYGKTHKNLTRLYILIYNNYQMFLYQLSVIFQNHLAQLGRTR